MPWTVKYTPHQNNYITQSQKEGNVDEIYSWASAQGWSKVSLSGALGCMTMESGLNPGAQDRMDSLTNPQWGIGLCQWTGPAHDGVVDMGKKLGKNWWDPEPQLAYLKYQLETVSFRINYTHAKNILPQKFRFSKGMEFARCRAPDWTVDKALAWFLCAYEMGGGSSRTEHYWDRWWRTRYPAAKEWYAYISKRNPSPYTGILYDAAMMGDMYPYEMSFLGNIQLTPYIVTLNRSSQNPDYEKLKELGVVGACLESGYLYDSVHKKQDNFFNPNLRSQVEELDKNKIPYGLYSIVRAKSEEEAKEEMYWLSFCVRKFPPKLGVWLQLRLSNSKDANDKIIETYKKELVRIGLKDKAAQTVRRDSACDEGEQVLLRGHFCQ